LTLDVVSCAYNKCWKMSNCRYRGIGIRIEDEVLITETGYEVISLKILQLIAETSI